jgi:hypothetical protein
MRTDSDNNQEDDDADNNNYIDQDEDETRDLVDVISEMKSPNRHNGRPRLQHSQSVVSPKKMFTLGGSSDSLTTPGQLKPCHSEMASRGRFLVSKSPEKADEGEMSRSNSETTGSRFKINLRSPTRTNSARILSKNYVPVRPRSYSDTPAPEGQVTEEGVASGSGDSSPTEERVESQFSRDDAARKSVKIKVHGSQEYNLRYPRMDWWVEKDMPPRPKDFTVLACMVCTCCNPILGAVGFAYARKYVKVIIPMRLIFVEKP